MKTDEPLEALMVRRAALLGELRTIAAELQTRGLGRTKNVVGELGERLALEVYGGQLKQVNGKDHDLVDRDGRRVQVKARELPEGARRPYQFSSLEFDVALCLRFDRATFAIEWAREISRDEFAVIARPYKTEWRAGSVLVAQSGLNVTSRFRDAWTSLVSE